MTGEGFPERFVAAARALVGVRFRAQGRDPRTGVDCLGVAIVAARAAGARVETAPPVYTLSGDGLRALMEAGLRSAKLCRLQPADKRAGDVLAFETAPALPHLGVWTGDMIVHAALALGRVVESPPDPAWRLMSAWRFPPEQ